MKTLVRQNPEVANKTRSNVFGWRGLFTLEFKPLECEGFSNCGEFATIRRRQGAASLCPFEFE